MVNTVFMAMRRRTKTRWALTGILGDFGEVSSLNLGVDTWISVKTAEIRGAMLVFANRERMIKGWNVISRSCTH